MRIVDNIILNESVTEYLLNRPKEAVNKAILATCEYYIQAMNKLS